VRTTDPDAVWVWHLKEQHRTSAFRAGLAMKQRNITAQQLHWLRYPGCQWTPQPGEEDL